MANKNVISKESISRLIKDITNLKRNPLTDNGIYYKHDEEDMLKGYALIVGPEDTPYYSGYYFFEFIYPNDYPFSPPKLNYLTNDGNTRFNPNLYKNGKVCVSILNTWAGEQWSSCQTINSILLTICSLLNNNPLINEPGIRNNHPDCEKYKKIIQFANIQTAICGMITKKYLPKNFEIFYEEIKDIFLKNYDSILKIIDNNILIKESIYMNVYNLNIFVNYELLKNEFIDCKKLLENINK